MWRELLIGPLSRRLAPRASAELFALGTAGVQEEPAPGQAHPPRQPWDTGPAPPPPTDVVVRAWFEDPDEAAIAARVAAMLPPGTSLVWEDVVDVDWETSWRANFPSIVISERLTVAPPWEASPGAVVIDPGQGFGTGQHETTRAALVRLDALIAEGGLHTALDVGCGSGVLALCAARLGLRAWGVDIDPIAVREARRNAADNGLDAQFDTTPIHRLTEPADLVLANLFAEVLAAVGPDLCRLTRKHLVLAGILVDREQVVREVFDPRMGPPHREQDGEWVCLHYQAPSSDPAS
jgi:ribosomal protein L11 methyltransferase